MGARGALAVAQGMTEAMVSQVERFEQSDLDERYKVALRFQEAFLLHPSEVSDDLKRQMKEHFTNEEILELVLRVTNNTINRIGRALGTDRDEVEVRVTDEVDPLPV